MRMSTCAADNQQDCCVNHAGLRHRVADRGGFASIGIPPFALLTFWSVIDVMSCVRIRSRTRFGHRGTFRHRP